MSEAAFKRDFDAQFFAAWGDAMGGIEGLYTPPGGAAVWVDVLDDTGIEQFGDDFAPVSHYATVLAFRREQIEPEQGATVLVAGITYRLAQRVDSSDQSISRWEVQHV